ncbi:response regulator receiver protein [Geothermobacter ehrlichii]|uniref:Response regulator receiver protein n=1 Tax=Geothermobacter ehrlichii TaxID=213224 RepID=A0A5D3WPF2_9BACT|nr:response regulator [Geothermobacter ehrlichii]TYP00224.1 response regulator receiver protein [Geothermobacter ehrlichii]
MGKSVLIVDDSSTMRKIVARSLRQAGFDFETILEAADGQEALSVLDESRVDIILSDINMPNMNGVEFLREKADNPAIANIPVVMITTEAGSDILREALQLGAKGSIKKPFTPDQVQKTLGEYV